MASRAEQTPLKTKPDNYEEPKESTNTNGFRVVTFVTVIALASVAVFVFSLLTPLDTPKEVNNPNTGSRHLELDSVSDGSGRQRTRPHILVFILDDWGYKDIGYHGAEFNLENIELLANTGIKLESYYTNPLCTPSRVAFMTGRQDIELGAQTFVFFAATKASIPKDQPQIGDAMKAVGYETHMIGKWHTGYQSVDELPNANGFDSFFGYLQGRNNYFSYEDTAVPFLFDVITCDGEPYEVPFNIWGEDLWHNFDPVAKDYRGQYLTDALSDYAVEMINGHHDREESDPLFMTIAHGAPHDPWQAPFSAINSTACAGVRPELGDRRILCGMLQVVDQGVGRIIDALRRTGYLHKTLIVFVSDNGAGVDPTSLPPPTDYVTQPVGSNFPLRGGKRHYFEGGTRVLAFVWGNPVRPETVSYNGEIVGEGIVSNQLIHVSDWYLTLQAAGGGSPPDTMKTVPAFDGAQLDTSYNQWSVLQKGRKGVRQQIYYEMGWPRDPLHAAVRDREFKLYVGANMTLIDGWFDASNPSEDEPICGAALGLSTCGVLADEMFFEIMEDPEERNPLDINNLDGREQMHYDELKLLVKQWQSIMVPALFESIPTIPFFAEALPQFWNCTWAPFTLQEQHPEFPDFIVTPTGHCTDEAPPITDCGDQEGPLDWMMYAQSSNEPSTSPPSPPPTDGGGGACSCTGIQKCNGQPESVCSRFSVCNWECDDGPGSGPPPPLPPPTIDCCVGLPACSRMANQRSCDREQRCAWNCAGDLEDSDNPSLVVPGSGGTSSITGDVGAASLNTESTGATFVDTDSAGVSSVAMGSTSAGSGDVDSGNTDSGASANPDSGDIITRDADVAEYK